MIEGTARDAHRRMEIVLVIQTEMEHHVQDTFINAYFLPIKGEILELFPEFVKPLLVVATFQNSVFFAKVIIFCKFAL